MAYHRLMQTLAKAGHWMGFGPVSGTGMDLMLGFRPH